MRICGASVVLAAAVFVPFPRGRLEKFPASVVVVDRKATWPPEVVAFLSRSGKTCDRPASDADRSNRLVLRITAPASGSAFHMVAGMPTKTQRLPFSAAGRPGEQMHWFVNDRYLGASASGEPLLWPLQQGDFRIVCADSAGHRDCVRIVVE